MVSHAVTVGALRPVPSASRGSINQSKLLGSLLGIALFIFYTAGPAPTSLDALGKGEARSRESGQTAPASTAETTEIEARDSYDRMVRLPKAPERIVSCAPNMTEILFFLGEGKRLVGRTDWCDWPAEVSSIPSIGGLQDPSIEKILSLKPDLVLASTHFQKETLEVLESARVPVFLGVVRREYGEVFELVRRLGALLGARAKAEEKARELAGKLEALRRRAESLSPKPRVYYMISFGDEGDYTAGADTHVSQLIRWAGGINVGDEIQGWQFSREALLLRDPDIILMGKRLGGPDRLRATPPYGNLRAVREGRVYEIDNDLIDRMGPRNVEGLMALVKILHPSEAE